MDIEVSQIIKVGLFDLDRLDPVTIFIENFSDGVGRITIVCYGKAWTSFWGAMGKDNDVAEFFCSCDEYYLAKNLSDISATVIDYEKISDDIGCDVDRNSMAYNDDKLCNVYGVEWYMDLPQTSNPDYKYLCRIILAVQEGLRKQFCIGI